jgi:hypothetical protein
LENSLTNEKLSACCCRVFVLAWSVVAEWSRKVEKKGSLKKL